MLRKALIISLFKQESWGQHVPIYRCRPFGNHHKRKPPFHFRKRGVNIRRFDRYQLTIKSSFLVHAGGQHAPFSPPCRLGQLLDDPFRAAVKCGKFGIVVV